MISPLRTALAVCALVMAAIAAPNLAAAAPPDGSYQQTCRNIGEQITREYFHYAVVG